MHYWAIAECQLTMCFRKSQFFHHLKIIPGCRPGNKHSSVDYKTTKLCLGENVVVHNGLQHNQTKNI